MALILMRLLFERVFRSLVRAEIRCDTALPFEFEFGIERNSAREGNRVSCVNSNSNTFATEFHSKSRDNQSFTSIRFLQRHSRSAGVSVIHNARLPGRHQRCDETHDEALGVRDQAQLLLRVASHCHCLRALDRDISCCRNGSWPLRCRCWLCLACLLLLLLLPLRLCLCGLSCSLARLLLEVLENVVAVVVARSRAATTEHANLVAADNERA